MAIQKVKIIPVTADSETDWLIKQVLNEIKSVQAELDKVGINYIHEVPWNMKFIKEAKGYLQRVRIGAIGRINTCIDAARLGVLCKCPALSYHFTSMGLYFVFRLARQRRRELLYIKDLEKWLTTYVNNKDCAHMFINYSKRGYYTNAEEKSNC